MVDVEYFVDLYYLKEELHLKLVAVSPQPNLKIPLEIEELSRLRIKKMVKFEDVDEK